MNGLLFPALAFSPYGSYCRLYSRGYLSFQSTRFTAIRPYAGLRAGSFTLGRSGQNSEPGNGSPSSGCGESPNGFSPSAGPFQRLWERLRGNRNGYPDSVAADEQTVVIRDVRQKVLEVQTQITWLEKALNDDGRQR